MSRPLVLLLGASLLFAASAQNSKAQTGEPPREPILRIETGSHTATVRSVSTDASSRYLVTASEDKTARVWEVQTGRLLRVLRAPAGEDNEGKLNAAAMSPDGMMVAAGGWTGNEWDGQNSVYLFDRESGRLLRRLTGLPNIVIHLAFSPDGALLAAALGGANGVRAWRVSDWQEVGRDADYGSQATHIDFDRAGRLVTVSRDGFVRLYGKNFRLLAKETAPGGMSPLSVSFSRDGRKVAVGYEDSTRVDVLSADDLKQLYRPDASGIEGNLARVAWSRDGARLYAGGTSVVQSKQIAVNVRRWDDVGRGDFKDVPAADDTILDLAPLASGGVAFASGSVWGTLDSGPLRVATQPAQIADLRGLRSDFLVDAGGVRVRFGYEKGGASPAVFSLADRTLQTGQAAAANLRPPRDSAPGVTITDLKAGSREPKLNGGPLALNSNEFALSAAVTPDGAGALLGTNFFLRLFDREGVLVWKTPAPGHTWGVNVTSDGKFALAAFRDGTIRWYRMSDGKEQLAFFPHADRRRWVLWTPSGYYDASPGAEDLIGWHVNNGKDAAAAFFPVGQFRSVYYRPDVVSKVLQTGDEQLALKEANEEAGRKQQQATLTQMLPPVVEIVSPADGAEVTSDEVAVRFRLRTPSGEPVTEVRALVDGRPAGAVRGLTLKAATVSGEREMKVAGERELRVGVPEGESQVSVIASNRFTTSVPATVRVRFRKSVVSPPVSTTGGVPTNETTDKAFEIKPKLYVLAVGVSNYADPKLKLGYPAKDAGDFAAAMLRQKGGLYRDVVVRLLTDEHASKDEVLDGLDWIRKETTSKDVAMVLFAGHGVNDQDGRYFYLPYNTDIEKLLRTGVSFEDIRNTVSALAGKTLFFIDTCHSGNVLGGRRALGLDIVGVVNELSSAENGAVVFAASTGNQYSLENPAWRNGAFTLAVVEGFDGRADYTGGGRITINMLDLYISERVKELTKGQQTPTTAKPNTVPDFPVALRK